ncbi:MAG: spermidine/putrescine ABC transporter substrate-binding protein [Acidobacteriaceae bacterium]|nr:spermidine/putrescine ABC transporter substrate-binding protein [Acidobacteriaceae bacterium]
MNRRLFLMSLTGAAAACTSGRTPRLNVFNWDNYVAPSTIADFERRFECKVRYATYASAEEMLAKVMSGNSGWDVVFPSNSFVEPMRSLGLLSPLNHRRLPLLTNLEPAFQAPEWDSHLEWCVPYMHSSTGILYSRTVSHPPSSWVDLWKNEYQRRVTMLDDPAEVFAACLRRLGDSINSGDERELRRARDLAEQQKPLLRAYLNEEVRDQVVAGDVLVAQMWAQVAALAMADSPNLGFAFPAEGFALYADNACVLRESKHKDLAFEFVNYLLDAHVAGDIAIAIRGGTTNAAARALLPDSLRKDPVLYPDEETLRRGEWFRPLSTQGQQLRDRYWTEIKSA